MLLVFASAFCSETPSEGGGFGGEPIIPQITETEYQVFKMIMFGECTKNFSRQICAFAINIVRASKKYFFF